MPVHVGPSLQHLLCAQFEDTLQSVIRQLRASWLAGPALQWDAVYPLRQCARSEAESRLANTLTSGFLQFSQLLAGFDVLGAELEGGGPVTEQRIASLEQLLVQARYTFRDQGDGGPPP